MPGAGCRHAFDSPGLEESTMAHIVIMGAGIGGMPAAYELRAALPGAPEFALMLMSVMFDRLRFVGARLLTRKATISRRDFASTPRCACRR